MNFSRLMNLLPNRAMGGQTPTFGVGSVSIPPEVQIDAILTGKIWNLVHHYCDGVWGALASQWTVTFDQIVQEAKHRGLESFVAAKPISEGFWLLEADTGYVVCYFERGIKMYPETFQDLEQAFTHWLENELNSLLLPGVKQ